MFREEAVQSSRMRLAGSIGLSTPASWTAMVAALCVVICFGFLIIAWLPAPRLQQTEGVLIPDRGLVIIRAQKPGIVWSVAGKEGDQLKAGAMVASVHMDADLTSGDTLSNRLYSSLQRQLESLSSERVLAKVQYETQHHSQLAELHALQTQERASLSKISTQRRLIEDQQSRAAKLRDYRAQGLVNDADLHESSQSALLYTRDLTQLQQDLAELRGRIELSEEAFQSAETAFNERIAALTREEEALVREIAQAEAQGTYLIKSPVAGTLTGVTAHAGQFIDQGEIIAAVVPEGSRLVAELQLPSAAIGLLRTGQRVKLQVKAYPYQRYGFVEGIISEISQAPTLPRRDQMSLNHDYLARVQLKTLSVRIGENTHELRSGMAFQATIILEHRRIGDWLLDPFRELARNAV